MGERELFYKLLLINKADFDLYRLAHVLIESRTLKDCLQGLLIYVIVSRLELYRFSVNWWVGRTWLYLLSIFLIQNRDFCYWFISTCVQTLNVYNFCKRVIMWICVIVWLCKDFTVEILKDKLNKHTNLLYRRKQQIALSRLFVPLYSYMFILNADYILAFKLLLIFGLILLL